MAKPVKKLKTADKWKRKKWFTLIAPKLFQERVLGETPASDPDSLLKRTIKMSLMTLTSNIKRQNVNVTFEVDKVQGERAMTHVKAVELAPTSIKRKVGRARDKMDDSFVCTTKDGIMVRMKPLIVTNTKTSNSVKTALRKTMVEGTIRTVATIPYDTLVNDVLSFRFQKALKYALHKVFPIRIIDVRRLVMLGTGEVPELTEEEAKNTFYNQTLPPPRRSPPAQRPAPNADAAEETPADKEEAEEPKRAKETQSAEPAPEDEKAEV